MTKGEIERKDDILTYDTIPKHLDYELTEHIFMMKININSVEAAICSLQFSENVMCLIMMTFYFNQYFQICCNSRSPTSWELPAPHHSTISNTRNYKPNFFFNCHFRDNPKLRGCIWGYWWSGVDNWIHSQKYQVIISEKLFDLPEQLSPYHFLICKTGLSVPLPGDCD